MTDQSIRLAAALDLLDEAIRGLERIARTPIERSEIEVLKAAAVRLSTAFRTNPARPASSLQLMRVFDGARFQHLLDLGGPEYRSLLLDRLSDDLQTARRTASLAAQTLDWAQLRGATHVLISLVGSAGALSLQSLSEQLNANANAEDATGVAGLVGELLGELDGLIAVVAATKRQDGTAA
ncbi:hypothetical protein [Tabrizicola sp.]|uniref:hypothetical protein n=1 Tax=Tabrizicola sp. TaxID=2005166 RepID=UPI00286A8E29|nr:hypothetical protein [Tabrizicola sp.]